jgi:hypothetical protein
MAARTQEPINGACRVGVVAVLVVEARSARPEVDALKRGSRGLVLAMEARMAPFLYPFPLSAELFCANQFSMTPISADLKHPSQRVE